MYENKLNCQRTAGRFVAEVLQRLKELAVPGNTTGLLNDTAGRMIARSKFVKSSFLGYRGYPAYVCTSIDDEVVHGVPSYKRVITEGSILSIDFAVSYKGWHADACITVPIGTVSDEKLKLLTTTAGALNSAICAVKHNVYVGDISYIIQSYTEHNGFTPVTQFSGHAIGKELHERPQIFNFGFPESGVLLQKGMAIAIEPVIAEKPYSLCLDENGWCYRTLDGVLTAHFEHTVFVLEDRAEVLTLF